MKFESSIRASRLIISAKSLSRVLVGARYKHVRYNNKAASSHIPQNMSALSARISEIKFRLAGDAELNELGFLIKQIRVISDTLGS